MESAIAQFQQEEKQVEFRVKWLPFMLNPQTPEEGYPREEYFKKKFGISNPESHPMAVHLKRAGEQCGIHFNHASVIPNSAGAHALLMETEKDLNLQNKVAEVLFKKYFEEAKNVGSVAVLKEAAQEAGVKLEEGFFEGKKLQKEVKEQDLINKSELNVSGVPFFIFNNKYAFSGAQETATFIQVFKKILKKI